MDVALNLLKDVEVDAIIGPQKSAQARFVIDLGDRANVSIISFSATSPSLHPRSPYFIQTGLGDAAQVGAIAALVGYFNWNQVVLIHEDSDYGTGIVSFLSNALYQDVNARISYRSVVPLTATDDFLLQELYKMKTMQTRVFVVHVSASLASKLFLKARDAGMMDKGFAWIVTSGLMDLFFSLDSHIVDSMQGVLGVKPWIPKSRKLDSLAKRWKRKYLADHPDSLNAELSLYGLWAYDTLWALAMAAEGVGFKEPASLHINTSVINSTNLFATAISKTGPKIQKTILGVTFQGFGGEFHLVERQLEPSALQILNVVGEGVKEVGKWTTSHGLFSGGYTGKTSSSNKTLGSIVFPGDTKMVPRGWEVPVSGKRLRVGVPVNSGFKEFVEVKRDPETNALKVSGCYIDIFEAAMKALPYAVLFDYFSFENPDGSSAGSYDELTQQVFLGKFDAVVGDITITFKRSQYADFTMPYDVGGVTIIVPIELQDTNDKWIFLKPLSIELWLVALGLFCGTGVALWILEHKSNKAYQGSFANQAGMIFYFPFMSLVFAHSQKIETILARGVVVVWTFVVLILTSTYTASLSARLTVQRLSPPVIDANELIQTGAYVGCRNGSFLIEYLQNLGFDKSKIRTYNKPELSAEALSRGSENDGISAFFASRPYTNLFLSKYGDKYTTVGKIYPTDGFACAFTQGSPLVADVSRTLIEMMDSGRVFDILGQWNMKIPAYNSVLNGTDDLTRISLKSFKVLFSITGGVTTCCLVIFITIFLQKIYRDRAEIFESSSTIRTKVAEIWRQFYDIEPKAGSTHIGQTTAESSDHLRLDSHEGTDMATRKHQSGDT